MSVIEGFFDEIGFFESVCTSFEWVGDTLIVSFDKGIDLGSSEHPLADSLGVDAPCKLIFDGVVKSKLKVSKLVNKPNDFDVYYFEKKDLPEKSSSIDYEEFYMEGSMLATDPNGWFVWDVIAEKAKIDNLKG
ncbi:hypothetical protein [Gynuella sunshinyii]|uniref:Uncharacterized protein n=1 Tax=Gynuella sunshinyii YC6258 TaxID=1445510 RepID=A0A0C5VDV5_9GAMM|nr:hypothetical protein [Gynuella sunshinyii]AJQ92697.1 hypothetical Protein YC6258_00647 [Gynuella sunshinyii YC6258]